ncbi:WAS/WASL-interacting protein family member 1-like [Athalia rosae]|uniref:WAS/WASL-interacting protein family member 1-like n=1 Tax=Athalia rosae TaxID=37344 RepID=UPI002034222D|nr:WAS/WASL-interacting protein family member 1-like [Athalia rosae]
MRALLTILAVTLAVTVSGQQYQQSANSGYSDAEYADYESPRPVHPSPRSYATSQAPAQRAPAPSAPKPTPVAILKQINRHNEDGSYTYGFEGGDGSFKIETKLPTGEVKGKYGFVDDTGKVRVVEYGANKYGFQPSGEGITVAPPTLVDETTNKDGLHNTNTNYQDYGDYQQPAPAPPRPQHRPAPPAPAPLRPQENYERAQYAPQSQPEYHRAAQTQAIYTPQQNIRARIPAGPPAQSPIFSPAAQSAPPLNIPHSRQELGYAGQRPAPVHQSQAYDEPEPIRPQYNQQGPVQFSPAPQNPPRPQLQARSQGGGILDQLARDYALPQGGAAPLHDISFGYY